MGPGPGQALLLGSFLPDPPSPQPWLCLARPHSSRISQEVAPYHYSSQGPPGEPPSLNPLEPNGRGWYNSLGAPKCSHHTAPSAGARQGAPRG